MSIYEIETVDRNYIPRIMWL